LADIFTWTETWPGIGRHFTWTETWPGIGRHFYMNWNLTRYWQTFLHELEPDQVLADIFSWTKTCLGKGRHSTWQGIDRHFYISWNLTRYWQTFYMNWNLTRCGQTFLHDLKPDQVLIDIFTWTKSALQIILDLCTPEKIINFTPCIKISVERTNLPNQ
jgi:hypothetical protein